MHRIVDVLVTEQKTSYTDNLVLEIDQMNLNDSQINLINLQNMIASATDCRENTFIFRYRKQRFSKETSMTLLLKRCSIGSLFQRRNTL